jgi:prepilin-type N-terminal cleavage/methylation domain-containing protein
MLRHVRGPARAAPSRTARGFTLIELLVVIAVIAILMTILLPVYRMVRRQAKTAQCLNNVKQCAHAVQLYLQDSRDMCPPWITFDRCQPAHGNAWWTCVHYLLEEYADKPDLVWTCPADDTGDCTPWDGSQTGGDRLWGYRHGCSYFYNNGGGSSAHAAFEGLSLDQWYGKRVEDIPNPSKKITMCCWSAHNFWWGVGPGLERQQWWHSDPPELKAPVGFLDMSATAATILPGQAETPQYQW